MIIGGLQVGMTMFAGRSVVTPTVETVRTGKIVCGSLLRLVSVSGTVCSRASQCADLGNLCEEWTACHVDKSND